VEVTIFQQALFEFQKQIEVLKLELENTSSLRIWRRSVLKQEIAAMERESTWLLNDFRKRREINPRYAGVLDELFSLTDEEHQKIVGKILRLYTPRHRKHVPPGFIAFPCEPEEWEAQDKTGVGHRQ
jgi:hypothetical protein